MKFLLVLHDFPQQGNGSCHGIIEVKFIFTFPEHLEDFLSRGAGRIENRESVFPKRLS